MTAAEKAPCQVEAGSETAITLMNPKQRVVELALPAGGGKTKVKKMPGKETHEQLLRTLERRTDPDAKQSRAEIAEEQHHRRSAHRNVKLSELPISRGGMNKENRDHNKHNDPGQSGHQPQDPSPDQEKH